MLEVKFHFVRRFWRLFELAITQLGRIADSLAIRRIRVKSLTTFSFSPTFTVGTFEGETMFTLPDDHADVPFAIAPVQLFDVEGAPITSGFTEEFVTSNDQAVAIVLNDANDLHAGGVLKIVSPGIANLNHTVIYNGAVVLNNGGQFTITTGAFGSVSGGDLTFTGISEDPAPPSA